MKPNEVLNKKIRNLKFEPDLFEIKNNILPAKGAILISEPFSRDLYFRRSVVLLIDHNKEGSMGFILNKRVNFSINEAVKDFPDFDAQFNLGGPVATDTIHFIHTLGDKIPGTFKIAENLFWGGDFETMKLLIKEKLVLPNQVRFFIGYSGWSENQLDEEIKNNSWLVANTSTEFIMHKTNGLWKKAVKATQHKNWVNIPEDPNSN